MVIVTIAGADKSGALARISTLLVRKGYRLKGQQLTESAGTKLVRITLDLIQVDPDKLTAEIKSLNPDYRIVNVEVEGGQSAAGLVKEMAGQFPNIAPLVQAYSESFGSETREKELFEAGKRIGAFHYDKEWSFGSPLKMPVALRRTLVPALENLGKVDATDTTITLRDSPFCRAGKMSCCEFLTGFMQGFLEAGPLTLTQNTRVKKATCRAKGDARCTYTVNYDL